MPTETTTRKKIYTGNGSQKTFPFTFPIHSESDIVVKLRTIATGATETLALTTHYTVVKSGASWDNGGNVVMVAAYASTYTITILRVTGQTQTKDYVEGGNFPAESHEEGLDKLTRITQELQEQIKRCLKMPDTDDENLNMEIPNSVDRLSKWLGFGPGAEPTCVQTTPPTVGVTPFMETVLDDDDAETACDTIGALDVNNDTLDDVPEGTTYGKVLAANLTTNQPSNVLSVEDQGTGAAELKCKVIELGDWDMDASATRTIEHGLTLANIISVTIFIRNDAGDETSDLVGGKNAAPAGAQGTVRATTDSIIGARKADGDYDSVDFDDQGGVAGNRGWMTIWYKA